MVFALKKYQRSGTLGFAIMLTILAFIVNLLMPSNGIPLSGAGLSIIVGFLVLAAVTALVYDFLALPVGFTGKSFMNFFYVAFAVLVIASLVTPLADWIRGWIPL